MKNNLFHSHYFSRLAHLVLAVCCVTIPLPALAANYNYAAPIEFRTDLVKILERADIMWDANSAQYHNFSSVQVSADGSRVLFNVSCEFCAAELGHRNRLFIVNPDGTGLRDISDIYPLDIISSWWGWGSLRINDNASTVFLRTQRNIGYYGEFHWYTYDLASGQRKNTVQNPFRNVEANIDATGSRLYFSPYDAGWDEACNDTARVYFSPTWAMHLNNFWI